jgi:hypothetical protein
MSVVKGKFANYIALGMCAGVKCYLADCKKGGMPCHLRGHCAKNVVLFPPPCKYRAVNSAPDFFVPAWQKLLGSA